MLPYMSLKNMVGCKDFTAKVALLLLAPLMNSHVFVQISFLSETLATAFFFTVEGTFTCVDS
jgi:hypothetical protein